MIRSRVACVGVVLLLLVSGCRQSPPEEAIRENLAELVEAIRARDAGDVRAFLDPRFEAQGGMDRQSLYRFAVGQFLRHRHVYIVTADVSVAVNPDDPVRAVMNGVATLAGGDRALPSEARLYRFRAGWRYRDGVWRIKSLRWE